MVSADTERQVIIWRGGEPAVRLDLRRDRAPQRPRETVRSVAFSPDGRTAIIATGYEVGAYSVETGEPYWKHIPARVWLFLSNSPSAVSMSPEGDLAMAFEDGLFGVWDLEGRCLHLGRDNDAPRFFAHIGDGRIIAGTDRRSLCQWDAKTLQMISKAVPKNRIHAFAVSRAAPVVATRSLYGVTLWHAETGGVLNRIPVGSGLPLVACSPRDEEVAIGDSNGIHLYRFDGTSRARLEDPLARAISVAYHPSGEFVAVGLSDGQVAFWSV